MAVNWSHTSVKVPEADFRDFHKWQETNRYAEIVRDQNKQSEKKIKTADL